MMDGFTSLGKSENNKYSTTSIAMIIATTSNPKGPLIFPNSIVRPGRLGMSLKVEPKT